jgi:lysophospholipase L1-like esterase
MFKGFFLPVLFIISLLLILIFMGGLVASIAITSVETNIGETESQEKRNQEESLATQDEDDFELLLIGDSVATGIGDESGGNLGERYVELAEQGTDSIEWKVVNLSLPGSQSKNWIRLLEQGIYRKALQSADLIFLSIGGNNLKAIYKTESLAGLVEYKEELNQYLSDLQIIMNSIEEWNPNAQVVFIGLYNPYGVSVGVEKIRLLHEWNNESQLLVDDQLNWVYVPLYDLFKYHQEEYLFDDDIHPNKDGYDAIANRIYEVVGKKISGK